MPGSPIVFFILAVVALGTAAGMLVSRNTVYSALLLALNFVTVAMLYLILGAPFIALSQITVYAGSIMVLFLFVIMLLGAENLPKSQKLKWQQWAAIPLALILAVDLAFNLFRNVDNNLTAVDTTATFGDPAAIGQVLFNRFALPFEITAVILLAAAVGAIMLAKPDGPSASELAQSSRKNRTGQTD